MGYNGGAGCQFFESWRDIGSTVRSSTGVRPSLLASLAFHHENLDEHIKDPMSLSGMFANGSILNNLHNENERHYLTSKYYDDVFLKDLRVEMMDDETNQAGDSHFYGTSTNFVCYQGLTAHQGPTRAFDQYTINTGHLGDSETTDCKFYLFIFIHASLSFVFRINSLPLFAASLAWAGHLAFKTSVDYHRAGNSVSLMNKTT
jgi:hypothetical protein